MKYTEAVINANGKLDHLIGKTSVVQNRGNELVVNIPLNCQDPESAVNKLLGTSGVKVTSLRSAEYTPSRMERFNGT